MSALGPEARSILGAGKNGDDPTAADRGRVRRKLTRALATGGAIGAASAAAAAESTAAAAAGKAVTFLAWAKIAGGLLFVGALGAGVWYSRPLPPGQSPPASVAVSDSAPRAAQPSPAAANTVSPSEAAPAPADMPSPEASAAPAPRSTAGARGSSAPPSASADALVDETRQLREAHGALQSGDPAKALKLLDEQSAAYADGQLGQERTVARVLALCKLGKDDEARATAEAFLRDHLDSPLVSRVRGGCAPARTP